MSGSGSSPGIDKVKLEEKLSMKLNHSKDIFMSDGTDVIAIKLSIQFCVSIKACSYLFNDVFNFFRQHNLSDKFLHLLEPSILAGRFREEIIPDRILRMLILFYEKKEEFHTLEKLV
jgi:hypothetical protein